MPDLKRLEIVVEPEEAELLSAALSLSVTHGWEEETLPDGRALCRVHAESDAFREELRASLAYAFPAAEITLSEVESVNWVEAWKEFFTPVEGGKRFMVLAPWMKEEKEAALASGRKAVVIEPKTAFGTGHHATTALCLGAVSDLADSGLVRPGTRFLDLGTGSGILGVACCLNGLSGLGLDIDRLAVENAMENRAINGIAEKDFGIRLGSLDGLYAGEVPAEYFDLVLANILAEPLKDMAPRLAPLARKGGVLVLSGILAIQADAVEAVYRAQGLTEAERRLSGEWAALVFRT